MTRIRKNYYKLSFGSYVGVLVDEELMKKIAKLQFDTKEKLLDLLENNEDHMIENYSWSIADEPKEINQSDRIFNYARTENYKISLDNRMREMFEIEKVKHLYDVTHLDYPFDKETAQQEHTNYLNKEEN